jgi:hypothetical protein
MSVAPSVDRREHSLAAMRRMTLGAAFMILAQAGIGMATNLYVVIPAHHTGANPSDYFTGSAQSIGWSVSHGAIILAIHSVLGFALVVLVINLSIRVASLHRRALNVWTILAALFVVGAGFNGASFLDFNNSVSSLLMSLLAFASIACYVVVLFLLSDRPSAEV